MSTKYLVDQLEALSRNFAQYRVEMALRLDGLERRLATAEAALAQSSFNAPGHSLSSRATTPMVGARPGFSEHRRLPGVPPPLNTGLSVDNRGSRRGQPPTAYDRAAESPQSAVPLARRSGSGENATFLPFTLERIASAAQKKSPGDQRTCVCGRPTFDTKCFREGHFRWCRSHQRPIMHGHHNCGRDYRNCQSAYWEDHDDWEMLVKTSFDSGFLGSRKVKNLYEVLFPEEKYPEKYQNGWYVG